MSKETLREMRVKNIKEDLEFLEWTVTDLGVKEKYKDELLKNIKEFFIKYKDYPQDVIDEVIGK